MISAKEKGGLYLNTIKLGLIPSPSHPADLTSKIVDDLPDMLADQVDDHFTWKPEILVDPLVGSAEHMNRLMDKVINIKKKNNWDYVICLTDLPQFMEKHIIMADINRDQKVALVSIPSFGLFPIKTRIKRTIKQVTKEMYLDSEEETDSKTKHTRKSFRKHKKQTQASIRWPVQRVFINKDASLEKKQEDADSKDIHKEADHTNQEEETQENTEKQSDVRHIIQSKAIGQLRILAGMVYSNQPWKGFFSFKKVLMFAFGTGVYITIFPTPWELSTIYSISRFITLMAAAIIAMVAWMIFAHNLWEKPTKKGDKRLRKLYNITTVSTLGIIVLFNYILLFCIFLATLYLFVPQDLFQFSTDIGKDPAFKYYVQLTWLIASLGTLAGSIGATSEDETTIREITYSYRQINRYYEIQDDSEKEKSS